MPQPQTTQAPKQRNSKQRGLNSRNILKRSLDHNVQPSIFKSNRRESCRLLRSKNQQLGVFSLNNTKLVNMDPIIKAKNDIVVENRNEQRFILVSNLEIQANQYHQQQECKEELISEISKRVPKSPPACTHGDFNSIEFLDN